MSSSHPSLCIGVFSTHMIEKYVDQTQACHETWEPMADQLGIKVFYHIGQSSETSPRWSNLIHLKDTGDDYNSAFLKHFHGLKHMYESVISDWYYSVGSDTYPHLTNILNMLHEYKLSGASVVTGHHGWGPCQIDNLNFKFYSGGGGYFVSRSALTLMLPYLDIIRNIWDQVCLKTLPSMNLKPACDVAFFYIIHKYKLPIQIIIEPKIQACDYNGLFYNQPCPWRCQTPYSDLLVCHFMDPVKARDYYQMLKQPHYIQNYERIKQGNYPLSGHALILTQYAQECQIIVETIHGQADSSWIWLYGLVSHHNPLETRTLITVDTDYAPYLSQVQTECRAQNINHIIMIGQNIQMDLPKMDLLFINTWHIYGQVYRELKKHESQVRKYIILHNTVIDAITGESLRMGMDINHQVQSSGYPIQEICKGIGPAIEDFLKQYPHWSRHQHIETSYGLTILKRSKDTH